jgi:hypothetical protein
MKLQVDATYEVTTDVGIRVSGEYLRLMEGELFTVLARCRSKTYYPKVSSMIYVVLTDAGLATISEFSIDYSVNRVRKVA